MKPYLYLCSLLSLPLCKSMDPMAFKREDYLDNNLKVHGYFYAPYQDSYYQGYVVFFLYRNGVYKHEGLSPGIKSLDELDDRKRGASADIPWGWGLYKIEGDAILIERRVSGFEYPTQVLIGRIANDSTIVFHTQFGDYRANHKDKPVSINETFRFRPFAPKPDSTTKFVEPGARLQPYKTKAP
jgi:hypothetical protein